MGKVVINSYEDFEKLVGQQIGISPSAPKWKARSTAQLPTAT